MLTPHDLSLALIDFITLMNFKTLGQIKDKITQESFLLFMEMEVPHFLCFL